MKNKLMKLVSIILSITIMSGMSGVCRAESNSARNNVQIDIVEDLLDPQIFEKPNEELIALGKAEMAKRVVPSKTLSVIHYFQDGGQLWSNDIMQTCGSTIKSAGCCLTSFSMIQVYLGGINNPKGVNSLLGNYACPFNYTKAANIFGYTIRNYKHATVTDTYAKEFIVGAIASGYPVLVGMAPDGSGNTHFVTAYGYNGDTIYIHDPSSGRNYTTLDQYLRSYYVNRLYVFKK